MPVIVSPCIVARYSFVILSHSAYHLTQSYVTQTNLTRHSGHGAGYNHPTRVSTGGRRPSMSAAYLADDNTGEGICVCQPVCLSVCLSVSSLVLVCLTACLTQCLPVCWSVFWMTICLSVCQSVCHLLCLFVK